MKKVCLVHSPVEEGVGRSPYIGVIPPLAVLSLSTFLRNNSRDLEIRVLDGDLMGVGGVGSEIAQFSPDVVGISATSCESYRPALKIASAAKGVGAKVILGGEQASSRAKQIIINQPNIDYVAIEQGEAALLATVNGASPREIPDIFFREGGPQFSHAGRRLFLNRDEIPIPDRTFLDLNQYRERFAQTTEAKLTGANSYGSAKTQNGCAKAMKKGPCSFCSRTDLAISDLRSPTMFWKEMAELGSLGVDYVWEVSPSFTGASLDYLNALASAKPRDSKMRFRMYCRADELCDERKVEAIKRMGIENALVGFESGNQDCLDASNKGTTIEQHIAAAKNLAKYGISTCSAFIVGHRAETRQSMQDTLHHAMELKEILGEKLYRVTTVSTLQPYPGTREFRLCLERFPELREEAERDMVNMNLFTTRYFNDILHLDISEADAVVQQIRDLSPIGSGKGGAKIKYGPNTK